MSMGIPKDLLELTISSFSSGRELWSPWVFLDHSLPNRLHGNTLPISAYNRKIRRLCDLNDLSCRPARIFDSTSTTSHLE